MSSEWKAVSLGECVELDTGFAFKSSGYTDSAEAVRLLRGDNIGQGQLRWDGARKWLRQMDDALADFELRENDLVLAMDRPWIAAGLKFARVRKGDLPALLVQRVARLRPKVGVDEGYLHSVVASPDFTEHIQRITTGTAVPHISGKQIKEFKFKLPDFGTQQALGKLLISLDDRITLLRETNATLEAIAQALFKSWFVDFDPVRAKMEGRAPEGMDEAAAALFPDGFEESALGLVPRGWRVGTLADLANLNPESWTARNQPARIAYVDLANTKDNEITSVTNYVFDEAPSRARRVLRMGDTIVGTVRPGNRSFAFIHEPTENLTGSTGFAVLRPSAVESTEFVFLAATQDASIEHLSHVADGGAYPAVRPDVVAGLQCVIPDTSAMNAFHAVVEPLLVNVSENQKQAQTLATLRDTLLPRLISGALRLPEST